jgi:hypothetical protein
MVIHDPLQTLLLAQLERLELVREPVRRRLVILRDELRHPRGQLVRTAPRL